MSPSEVFERQDGEWRKLVLRDGRSVFLKADGTTEPAGTAAEKLAEKLAEIEERGQR